MITTEELAGAAVAAARTALLEQVGEAFVGDHDQSVAEDSGVFTHYFGCTQPGYPGWRWAVTVAQPEGQDAPTIDEVVLLPGDDAITAPAWIPWRERIKPGDLSPGDLLPADEDDPRLAPTYLTGDPGDWTPAEAKDAAAERAGIKAVADELGLGRARVLSIEGRDSAAQRWYDGEQGPDVPLAQSAPAQCYSCGFLVQLAGPLSRGFGVCANEFANDDGRVVAHKHGCGAHSEAQLRKKQLPPPLPDPVFDTVSRSDLEDF
ncbi:DUF3027 domain-containing protein [Marmoricola sp. OAE513]|uniref:DUF3027 domain-containing protein n=1 Tax=Marmoricola sp. OAE513 TaxID=2817894 RepID=UPI001D4F3946